MQPPHGAVFGEARASTSRWTILYSGDARRWVVSHGQKRAGNEGRRCGRGVEAKIPKCVTKEEGKRATDGRRSRRKCNVKKNYRRKLWMNKMYYKLKGKIQKEGVREQNGL